MPRSRIGKYISLNVVLHPHPPGSYRKVFAAAAEGNVTASVRSDRKARLGPISSSKDGIFSGVIAFWTDIDSEAKGIGKSDLQQSALKDLGVALPANIGFNSRIFAYSFNEKTHKMIVQTKNDEGEVVSNSSILKAVEKIIREAIGPDYEDIHVHLDTEKDALRNVMSLQEIKKVRIVVFRPNPDSLDERVEKKKQELERGNIAREETIATKAKNADTIKFVGDLRATAELAKTDGFVEVVGKLEGKTVTRSTQEFPKEISVELNGDETSAGATRRLAGQ